MNNQNESPGDESPKIKQLNGALIDLKLYIPKITKQQQAPSANIKKDKKIIDEVNEQSVPFYNELHYGNYE